MKSSVRLLTQIVSCCLALATASAVNAGYVITDLGTLPGTPYSYPGSINDQGTIVGSSTSDLPITGRAFLYQNGKMQDLGTLPGHTYSTAAGVNASGQVAGASSTTGTTFYLPGQDARAVLYSNGKVQNLGTLPKHTFSYAAGINQAGAVVGTSVALPEGNTLIGAVSRGFIFSNGVMKDLGTLGGSPNQSSFALAINNQGHVTGGSDHDGFGTHAFVYKNGAMQDLGALVSGGFSLGAAINEAGQVAGSASSGDGGSNHAFLHKDGVMHDLGTLGGSPGFSAALGINDSGKVVGYSTTSYGGLPFGAGFLFTDGKMTDLNALTDPDAYWHITSATDINNLDEIVATGMSPEGDVHALLLTPDNVHDTPEPTGLTMGLVGAGCLAWVARRRKRKEQD